MFGSAPAPPHDARRAASRLRRIRKQQHRLRAKAGTQPASSPQPLPPAQPSPPINAARMFPAPLPSAPDQLATMQAYIQAVSQTIGGVGNPMFRRVMTAVEDLLTHASCSGAGGRVSEAAIEAAKGRTLQAIHEALAFRPKAQQAAGGPTSEAKWAKGTPSEAKVSGKVVIAEAAAPDAKGKLPQPAAASFGPSASWSGSEARPASWPGSEARPASCGTASEARPNPRGSPPKDTISIDATFSVHERRGAGVPKWHDSAPRQPSTLACAPSFAPQFEAHCCVANAFADLEEVLGRYSSRRAGRFEAFLRRRPEFPVVLTRLPFVAVEQLLLAVSSCTFRELFVWFAEILDPRFRTAAWRPPRQTFRRGGDTSEAARRRFEAQAPREAPDELLRADQYAQPAAVTLSSEVNLYDWRGGLRVRSGRFSALVERLAAKYGPRGEDLLDLAYQLLARAAKKQTAFVAVYVGPEGPSGACPCGFRDPAPAFRAQRVFEWRVLGRLTPPSCYQILTVLPLDPDGVVELREKLAKATRKLDKLQKGAAAATAAAAVKDRLSARVSATVLSDAFRSSVIKRFVIATEDRIGGRIVRAYLLGETDIPFVSLFVRPQAAVPPDNVRLPSQLRDAGPGELVMIQYELQPLRDAPWTNVAFAEESEYASSSSGGRRRHLTSSEDDDDLVGPAGPCTCDQCDRRRNADIEERYDFAEDVLDDADNLDAC
jgi:hypothetical protein